MKRIAFLLCLVGLCYLVFLFLNDPVTISLETLNSTILHTEVFLTGKVTSQRFFEGFSVFEIGSIDIACECTFPLEGKLVAVTGLVEEYQQRRQIKALTITVLE